LGRLSYPVYLLHLPIAIGAGFAMKIAVPEASVYGLVTACCVLTLLISWAALVIYDEPVRGELNARLHRTKGSVRQPTMPMSDEQKI
jgi:peptidoglycan/LPS O-acetylase OafA/YrhL